MRYRFDDLDKDHCPQESNLEAATGKLPDEGPEFLGFMCQESDEDEEAIKSDVIMGGDQNCDLVAEACPNG